MQRSAALMSVVEGRLGRGQSESEKEKVGFINQCGPAAWESAYETQFVGGLDWSA